MAEWLESATELVALVIDWMALAAIAIGTIEAVVRGLGVMLSTSASNHDKRLVWLHYARWLVVGLTFQLAADIIETSVAPSWDDIGKLAAIAAVRTFLNFFLERDLAETLERDRESRLAAGRAE
jgi:uncharacterized membrane protein